MSITKNGVKSIAKYIMQLCTTLDFSSLTSGSWINLDGVSIDSCSNLERLDENDHETIVCELQILAVRWKKWSVFCFIKVLFLWTLMGMCYCICIIGK